MGSSEIDYGQWYNLKSDLITLPTNQQTAYYKFTVNKGDKIYVRCSYDSDAPGMSLQLYNSNYVRVNIDDSSNLIYDSTTLTPFLAVNCNGTSNAQTFYIAVDRGSTYSGLPDTEGEARFFAKNEATLKVTSL